LVFVNNGNKAERIGGWDFLYIVPSMGRYWHKV